MNTLSRLPERGLTSQSWREVVGMERTGERGCLLHRLPFRHIPLGANSHAPKSSRPSRAATRTGRSPVLGQWMELGSAQLEGSCDLRRSISPEPVAIPVLGAGRGTYGAGHAPATCTQGSHCCRETWNRRFVERFGLEGTFKRHPSSPPPPQ